jgi:hypothetical protein
MGAPSVVVGRVLFQDCLQVPLAEDQHLVGELGPGCEHEPFGITVRARAAGRVSLSQSGRFLAAKIGAND